MVMMWRASRPLISCTSGERGRFARSGGTADKHESPRQSAERLHTARQAERCQARHHRGQTSNGGCRAAALVVEVDPEPAQVRRAERRVRDAGNSVHLARVGRQDEQHRVGDLLAAQRCLEQRSDDAVHTQRRRRARDQQQIACAAFDDVLEPRAQAGGLVVRRRGSRQAGVELGHERVEIVRVAVHVGSDSVLLGNRHRGGGAHRENEPQRHKDTENLCVGVSVADLSSVGSCWLCALSSSPW